MMSLIQVSTVNQGRLGIVAFCVFVMLLSDVQLGYLLFRTTRHATSPTSSPVGPSGAVPRAHMPLPEMVAGLRWLLQSRAYVPPPADRQQLLAIIKNMRAIIKDIDRHERQASQLLTRPQSRYIQENAPKVPFTPQVVPQVQELLVARSQNVKPGKASEEAPGGLSGHFPVTFLMIGILGLEGKSDLKITPRQAADLKTHVDALTADSKLLAQQQGLLGDLLQAARLDDIQAHLAQVQKLNTEGPAGNLELVKRFLQQAGQDSE